MALVDEAVRQGPPAESVVGVTGLPLTPEVRRTARRGVLDRRPVFDRITPDGVAWADGRWCEADVILWATGSGPPSTISPRCTCASPAAVSAWTAPAWSRDARVHLVGYGPSASTIGANRAGRAAVNEIRAWLAPAPALD